MGHTAESGVAPTAFELVNHETRIEILRELAIRQQNWPRAPFLSFSELRKRIGHHDPGNFNYHLDRLVGRLVVKQAEGYRLSYGGLKMVGAVATNRFDRSEGATLPAVDATCYTCGEPATPSYEEGLFRLECADGHTFTIDIPRTIVDQRMRTDLSAFVSLVTQQKMELVVRDICPLCHGRMPSGIEATTEDEHTYLVRGTCEDCGLHVCNTVGSCVVRHPAVVAFHYEHGIDVRTEPYWDLQVCAAEPTVCSDDPLCLEVAVQHENETLTLTLDDDATVTAVERSHTVTGD